jgi:hypothetical protein
MKLKIGKRNVSFKRKKRQLNIAKKVKNFTKAIVRHASNNFRRVTQEEYNERMSMCGKCDYRDDKICSHMKCGCYIARKAWWESENCPDGKWLKLVYNNT